MQRQEQHRHPLYPEEEGGMLAANPESSSPERCSGAMPHAGMQDKQGLTVGMAIRNATSVPRQSAVMPSRRAILRMPSKVLR